MKLLSNLFVDIKHTINNTNNIYMDVFNIHVHVPPQTKIRAHVYRKNLVLLSVRPSVCAIVSSPYLSYGEILIILTSKNIT